MKSTRNDGCPSCSTIGAAVREDAAQKGARLSHWPIQIKLIGTVAPFLNDADLLVAADCTAFAAADLYKTAMQDRKVLIGCPKLDDGMQYVEKFTEIFSNMNIRSVSCLRMEVPCCGGMTAILREAVRRSGKNIPLTETVAGVKGDRLVEQPVSV
jgi:hypothetical protein